MRFIKTLIFLAVIELGGVDGERLYVRHYFPDGNLRSEGWKEDGVKEDYWYYYYPDGNVEKKGPYKNNREYGYWYFYGRSNNVLAEGSFKEGLKNGWWKIYGKGYRKELKYNADKIDGFVLIYKDNDLKKVERYSKDIKEGEWTSLTGFKRDNPNVKF